MRNNRYLQIAGLLLLLAALPSCASNKASGVQGSFSFLNTYESVQKDYEHGHIMEARAGALSLAKDKPGYAAAQKLLKEKIEPARLRLLRHYVNAAKREERRKIWFKAKELYTQAASFSTRNAYLLRKAKRMDLHIRQVRLNTILARKRKEDATLMAWLDAYDPPRQLDPQDEPFAHDTEVLQRWIEDRASSAYNEAKRNLRQGYPEVAYADIESYLRYEPDSSYGQKLMKTVRETLPKGLKIPAEPSSHKHRAPRHRTKQPSSAESRTVTEQEIRALIKQKKWLQASKAVQAYRREDGKDAERLFKEVESHLEKEADAAFKAGRAAFRSEDINTAVKQWRRAVALQPENAQYIENLHRAEQLQERLKILRGRTGK